MTANVCIIAPLREDEAIKRVRPSSCGRDKRVQAALSNPHANRTRKRKQRWSTLVLGAGCGECLCLFLIIAQRFVHLHTQVAALHGGLDFVAAQTSEHDQAKRMGHSPAVRIPVP